MPSRRSELHETRQRRLNRRKRRSKSESAHILCDVDSRFPNSLLSILRHNTKYLFSHLIEAFFLLSRDMLQNCFYLFLIKEKFIIEQIEGLSVNDVTDIGILSLHCNLCIIALQSGRLGLYFRVVLILRRERED